MDDLRQEKNPEFHTGGVQVQLFLNKSVSQVVGAKRRARGQFKNYTALGKPNTRGESREPDSEIVW